MAWNGRLVSKVSVTVSAWAPFHEMEAQGPWSDLFRWWFQLGPLFPWDRKKCRRASSHRRPAQLSGEKNLVRLLPVGEWTIGKVQSRSSAQLKSRSNRCPVKESALYFVYFLGKIYIFCLLIISALFSEIGGKKCLLSASLVHYHQLDRSSPFPVRLAYCQRCGCWFALCV